MRQLVARLLADDNQSRIGDSYTVACVSTVPQSSRSVTHYVADEVPPFTMLSDCAAIPQRTADSSQRTFHDRNNDTNLSPSSPEQRSNVTATALKCISASLLTHAP